MARKGAENLIPMSKRSKEEARASGSKGGKASGEARRKRKALREQMQTLLELPVTNRNAFNKMSEFGIDIGEIDNNTRLVYCLLQKAFTGDVAAIKEVRSVIGEDQNADAMEKLDEMITTIKGSAHADSEAK